jgi:hypothetical protein
MTESDKKENLPSSNIFEDFSTDANLSEDITKLEEKKKHDSIYYLSFISSLLKWANVVLVFFLVFSFFYISIQKKQEPLSIQLLAPICWIFLWDTPSFDSPCSWVEYVKLAYIKDLEETKKYQFGKISSVIGNLYSLENFIYSKEVSFLLDRAKNRVKPLEIISKFDSLKNRFDPLEKSRIQCYNLIIDKTNLLRMTCEAYSSDWDGSIIWFDGSKETQSSIGGTSISLANSFINFINKNSTDFTIINKQKVFSAESIFNSGLYTRKTVFVLSLKYNDNNL